MSQDSDFELEISGDEDDTKQGLLQKLKNDNKESNDPEIIFNQDEIDNLFSDWDPQLPFSCRLTLDDITANSDENETKIFQIQILKNNEGTYGLFCKWAKLSGNYDFSFNKTESYKEAVDFFKEKFFEKTLNQWDDREIFKIKPGGYKWIGNFKTEKNNKMDLEKLPDHHNELKNRVALVYHRSVTQQSRIEKETINLLRDMLSCDEANKIFEQFSIEKSRLSIFDIEMKQLIKAHKFLADIEYELFSPSRRNQRLFELSNMFFEVMPIHFKMAESSMIDDLNKIRRFYQMLNALSGIHHMMKVMREINLDEKVKTNPLDQMYLNINCQLKPLIFSQSTVFPTIEKMITTHGPTHQNLKIVLKEVFQIAREGEVQSFWPFRNLKRRMLWMGSSYTKMVDILSNGLKIIRTESSSAANFFGKGIYFTNIISKAAKQSMIDSDSKSGLLLLCDVAVGNEFELDRSRRFSKPPKGYHSIKGLGKFDSIAEETIAGSICSIGVPQKIESERDSSFMYNEYAIYDESQIKLAYLLRVEYQNSD